MRTRTTSIAVAVAFALAAGAAAAQYPGVDGGYPAYGTANTAPPPRPPTMRAAFAQSLTAAASVSGNVLVQSLAQGLSGSITNWFDRRTQRTQNRAAGTLAMSYPAAAPTPGTYPGDPGSGYPGASPNAGGTSYPGASGSAPGAAGYPGATNYPGTSGAVPGAGYPGEMPAGTYPGTGATTPNDGGYPTTSASGGYPGAASAPAYPSADGGYPGTNAGYPGTNGTTATGGGAMPVYAGVAFEIQRQDRNGASQSVDPASYAFQTGERFTVYYRPSLPGRVDVYNVNPAGRQTQIDSTSVAGGQLVTLGPYEFTDLTGSETLILDLVPCSDSRLMAATRDIVKVQNGATPPGAMAPSAGGLALASCSDTVTRGLKKGGGRTKTRDIRKVSVEQGTSFALDPLSSSELRGGPVDARRVTIQLQHR